MALESVLFMFMNHAVSLPTTPHSSALFVPYFPAFSHALSQGHQCSKHGQRGGTLLQPARKHPLSFVPCCLRGAGLHTRLCKSFQLVCLFSHVVCHSHTQNSAAEGLGSILGYPGVQVARSSLAGALLSLAHWSNRLSQLPTTANPQLTTTASPTSTLDWLAVLKGLAAAAEGPSKVRIISRLQAAYVCVFDSLLMKASQVCVSVIRATKGAHHVQQQRTHLCACLDLRDGGQTSVCLSTHCLLASRHVLLRFPDITS